jgi:hypothetical protein
MTAPAHRARGLDQHQGRCSGRSSNPDTRGLIEHGCYLRGGFEESLSLSLLLLYHDDIHRHSAGGGLRGSPPALSIGSGGLWRS